MDLTKQGEPSNSGEMNTTKSDHTVRSVFKHQERLGLSGNNETTYIHKRKISHKLWYQTRGKVNGTSGAVIAGNTVTLTLVDGNSRSDDDGVADQQIVDPSGPASSSPAMPMGSEIMLGLILCVLACASYRPRRRLCERYTPFGASPWCGGMGACDA